MFFLIEESLKQVSREELRNADSQYVAVLSLEEWRKSRDSFEMGIDMDLDISEIYTTKAEVNYDSLTGSFSIPNREDFSSEDFKFAFALDEKGIVFIDNSGKAEEIIKAVQHTKKWKLPSLERFCGDRGECSDRCGQPAVLQKEKMVIKGCIRSMRRKNL